MIKLQLINADIIYDTAIVTSRLFRKSFNCRNNPRMDYAFCLLTLKSSEKWPSLLFGATGNFNHQILPYILRKGKVWEEFICVINYQHIDQWPRKTRESTTALGTKKKKACVCIKRVKTDSYLTYGQSRRNMNIWNFLS
jgi:hypothetical protein